MVDITKNDSIIRELPEIEDYKKGLLTSSKSLVDAANARAESGEYLSPDYEVAGMSPDQLTALQMGRQGIGAYQPFLTSATQGTATGSNTLGEAANVLRGADTRGQFGAAQGALGQAAAPIGQMGQSAQLAAQGVPLIQQGAQGIGQAQQLAGQYAQANLGQSQQIQTDAINSMNQARPDFTTSQTLLGRGLGQSDLAAQQAQQAANQPGFQQGIGSLQAGANQGAQAANQAGFGQAQGAVQQGIGALQGAAQGYTPGRAQEFMNPYQQQVIDESVRQINRQGDISRQNLQAQATRAGAFGGSREGIQRAELERGLAEQKNAAIVGALSQGYQSASGQAQQAFEAQQNRQLQQGQGLQAAGGALGSLAGQQAGLGLQAAGLQQNVGQAQLAAAGQQGQLGLQAAGQQAAAGQAGLAAAQQLSSQEAQNVAAQQQAAQFAGSTGQNLGQQQLQQAQLGQSAAGLQGNLAGQQAGLASLYGNVAGQQANIYGQQSQLGQSVAQGMGNLASQQFGIGSQMAQGLGSLGTQQANLGMQQAALGQQAQGAGQQDVNFLYNLGASQQKQGQAELDASRQNELQQNMQAYQQLGFLSDIYRGAPTSQMGTTTSSAPSASPFQQAAGLGIAALGATAAGQRAGVL
jgi:hypothetical protein